MTVQVPPSDGPDQPLCEAPFSGGSNRFVHRTHAWTPPGVRPRAAHPKPPRVRHRGQPSLSPWKTQCAQSNQNWLNAPPRYVAAPTGCEPRKGLPARDLLCWPWRPSPGNTAPSPGRPRARPDRPCAGGQPRPPHKGGASGGPARRGRPPDRTALGVPGWWRRSTPPRGPFRVQGTAAPEVKFLDRRKADSGAGVKWQGPVHRSRARAWGSKRIRHPRSPAP